MDNLHPIFLIPFITGPIFIIAGFVIMKYPPKKINWWYGYRTTNSMLSQERWDFAQLYAGRELIKSGGLLLLLSIPGWFLKFESNEFTGLAVGLGTSLVFTLIAILKTEKALRQKFGRI